MPVSLVSALFAGFLGQHAPQTSARCSRGYPTLRESGVGVDHRAIREASPNSRFRLSDYFGLWVHNEVMASAWIATARAFC